jgi:hypothetical protein
MDVFQRIGNYKRISLSLDRNIKLISVGIIAYGTVYYSMDREKTGMLIFLVLIVIFSVEIFDSVKQEVIGSFNLKTIGILLVITSVALIVFMYKDALIAVIGILGTIAGYLFGIKPKDE